MQNLRDHAVVIVGKRLFERAMKVPQEAFAGGGVAHNASNERGNIWQRIVAAPPFELREQSRGPVLDAGFPTIGQKILYAAHAEWFLHGVAIDVQIVFEVAAHQDRIELVNLQSGVPCLSRTIGLTGQ